MVKNLKSKFSTTHDQLSNAAYKIQNCYQHQQYYHNDLFDRRSKKNEQNKWPKNIYRIRNRNRKNKKRPPKAKCLNNCKISINSSSNSINSNSVANVFYCANCNNNACYKVHLKIFYHINNFVRHVCFYSNAKINNLHVVIILILLSAITAIAPRIDTDTQGDFQQNTSIKSPLLAAFNHTALMPTIHFNETSHTVACPHITNALLYTRAELYIQFRYNIQCHNLSHIHHRHRNNGQWYLQLHSSKSLANNKHIKLKNNNSHYAQNQIQINYQHNHHDSTTIVDKPPQQIYKNKNEIKIENKYINEITKEDKQHLSKTNDFSKYFQNHHTNKNSYYSNKRINNYNRIVNDLLALNVKSSDGIQKEKPANVIINDHVNNDINIFYNNGVDHGRNNNNNDDDGVKIKDFGTSLNLSPPAAAITVHNSFNNSLHFTNNQQQSNDHIKLMKLVIDGLGLKKVPNMATVNISQEEYVTKYKEYLQRVHQRKSRELRNVIGGYNGKFLRSLDILSIVTNNSLLSQHQEYNQNPLTRRKRNADDKEHDEVNEDGGRKQSLEERVRNILFLKKKYQKPRSTKKEKDERKTNIRLMFALKPEILNLSSSDIDEANIRLVLIHSPILAIRNFKNKKAHTKPKSNSCSLKKGEDKKKFHTVNFLNLKLYSIPKTGKRDLLDGRKVDIHIDLTKPEETHTQWLQFDVSRAVRATIEDKHLKHVVLELQCDNCKRIGARILNDAYNTAADALADDPFTEGHQLMPVLNIIGHFDRSHRSMRPYKHESHQREANEEETTQRHYYHQTYNKNNNKNSHNRRTNCYKANQRCCRHPMEVTFKEIKGFEFIIQPKVFDAGYCHGRCPPRYNPAHHHALLQSLLWKQNRKTPRPCCAPSKLVELEVLHVDEKDSEKLKISTWSDMRVVECACS